MDTFKENLPMAQEKMINRVEGALVAWTETPTPQKRNRRQIGS